MVDSEGSDDELEVVGAGEGSPFFIEETESEAAPGKGKEVTVKGKHGKLVKGKAKDNREGKGGDAAETAKPGKRRHRAGKKIAARKARQAAAASASGGGTSTARTTGGTSSASTGPPAAATSAPGTAAPEGARQKKLLPQPRTVLVREPARKETSEGQPLDESMEDYRLKDREAGRILAVPTEPRTYIQASAIVPKPAAEEVSRRLVKYLRHGCRGAWVPVGEAAVRNGIGIQSLLWTVGTSVGRHGRRRLELREVGLQGLEVRTTPK
jgi:hypothetical protein